MVEAVPIFNEANSPFPSTSLACCVSFSASCPYVVLMPEDKENPLGPNNFP